MGAAQEAGVDPAIVAKIAGFESGYNPSARPIASASNKNTQRQFDGVMAISTAHGYGQFLNGTWKDMLNQHGEKYGVANASIMTTAQANSPELRNDTKLQAAMLAEFTRTNADKGQKLGGSDADANVYAFHNLGERDATKLLKALRAAPDQRVDQVLSAKVIDGNPALYGNGSRTVAAAYQAMGKAMDKYEKYAVEATRLSASLDPLYGIRQTAERIKHNEPIFRSSVTDDGLPDYLRTNRPVPTQRDAMSDGVLRLGEAGPSVRALQDRLNDLSVADGHGRVLRPTGSFGKSTREAVENFQLWNGLPTNGIADRTTLEGIRGMRPPLAPHPDDAAALNDRGALRQQERPVAPSDPTHPDHAMLQQIRRGVRSQGEKYGMADEETCERVSRSLLAACKENGVQQGGMTTPVAANALTRVDHILFGSTGNIFAVEGKVDDPAHKWTCVPAVVAVQTPVEQSDQKLVSANRAIADQQAIQQVDPSRELHSPDPSAPSIRR